MANLSQEYAEIMLPDTVFITTVGILGVIGNVIVIILYCCKVTDENGDRYFIPCLAAADLLGSVSMTICNAVDNYFLFNYPSETCCKWLNYSLMFSGFLSSSLLLIIALQRYRKVCQTNSREFTLVCRRLAVLFTVIVSAIIMAPWLALSGTSSISIQFQERNVTGKVCKFIDKDNVHRYNRMIFIYMGFIYMIIIVILIILVVLYALIALRLRQIFRVTKTECKPLIEDHEQNYNSISADTNTGIKSWFNLMYGAIVIVYIVSFFPTAVLFFLTYKYVDYLSLPKHALVTWMIFSRFIIINHFVNPFIYVYFDVKFREALKQLCVCRNTSDSAEMSIPS
ncbi:thyrotropin-releasing hormone receptor-like [Ostrea edulis]|uniref:thyrotropin-releasing hormone receptor-like n=1 Tax=Ostrea edulis TaxID=37623 RepID=UPI0024AF18E5|nr:thyrotropin-releasing hormone receptor-like [Ostrea edulis]